MALEYSDKGSYAGLSSQSPVGWSNNPPHTWAGTCDQMYPLSSNSSAYISQANALCKKILEIAGNSGYALYVIGTDSWFSVESWFTNNLLYCVGSSGSVTYGKAWGDGPSSPDPNVVYNNPGCHGNP
jgi:hypothetical protein